MKNLLSILNIAILKISLDITKENKRNVTNDIQKNDPMIRRNSMMIKDLYSNLRNDWWLLLLLITNNYCAKFKSISTMRFFWTFTIKNKNSPGKREKNLLNLISNIWNFVHTIEKSLLVSRFFIFQWNVF